MKKQTSRDNSRVGATQMRWFVFAGIAFVAMAATAGEYLKNQTVNVGGNTYTYDLINVKMKLSSTADATTLNQWSNIVRKASRRIWNYTERQATLDKVTVYRRRAPSDNDILTQPNPTYGANATVLGLNGGGIIKISETGTYADGGVLAHECGHYVFGFYDEYCAVLQANSFLGVPRLITHLGIASPLPQLGAIWDSPNPGELTPIYDTNSFFKSEPYCVQPYASSRVASIMDGYNPVLYGDDPADQADGHIDTELCTPNRALAGWPSGVESWTTRHHGPEAADVTINGLHWSVNVRSMQDYMNNGESCWETAVRTRKLTVPQSAPSDDFPAHEAEWHQFQWILAELHPSAMICIDRSGSMGGDPGTDPAKIQNAKLGAQKAVENAEIRVSPVAGDNVGFVSYSTTASIDAPLTEMVGSTSKNTLKATINGIVSSGSTAIGDGLRKCLDSLTAVNGATPQAGEQEVIFLLSDGLQNQGENPEGAVLTSLKNRGVKINAFALGSDADRDLMRRLADATGGRYEFISNPSQLDKIYAEIYTAAREGQSSATLNGTVSASMQEREVVVDAFGNLDITFNLFWDSGDLDLNLVKPDGTVIDHAFAQSDPSIEFIESAASEFMRVHNPTPGIWKVRVIPVNVTGTQSYSVQVASIGEVNMALNLVSQKSSYAYPEPLLISASFSGPFGVKGVSVSGNVVRPDGSTVPFTLYDDGATNHGDAYAGDGQYANYFTAFKGDGDYRFEIVANNTNGMTVVPGDSPDYVSTVGSSNILSQPVPAFTRQAAITINYTGVPVFINVTPYSSTDFASWQLDRSSGAMVGSMVVSNYPTSFKTLSAPFWYGLLESQNIKLANPTGVTNGMPYIDITANVDAALQAKYGRQTMQPGEWVVIDGIQIYSRDRSLPEVSAMWALFADPPGGTNHKLDAYDFNKDGLIDDGEVLKAVHDWTCKDMDDFALLQRIQMWKDSPHPAGMK